MFACLGKNVAFGAVLIGAVLIGAVLIGAVLVAFAAFTFNDANDAKCMAKFLNSHGARCKNRC